MSTPSVTILKNLVLNWKSNQMEEETIATFYRHWDGYPSCHAIDIANSLVVASRTKPEQHIDFSGASVERNILNNRNWCQHFLKAMCMADADIEFIGEDNVPSASYTYVVTGAYDNYGGNPYWLRDYGVHAHACERGCAGLGDNRVCYGYALHGGRRVVRLPCGYGVRLPDGKAPLPQQEVSTSRP